MNVVGYLRKSTDEPDRQVYSLEAQKKAVVDIATAKGWPMANHGYHQPSKGKGHTTQEAFYVDEGISGTIFDRPALRALRQAAKRSKEFDLVLMVDFDRIARDNADSALIRRELEEYGVKVAECSAPDMDSSSTTGKLVYGIKGVVAEFERNLLVERVKRGMAIGKQQGKHMGRPALGYDIVDGRLVLNQQGERVLKMLRHNPRVSAFIVWKELKITEGSRGGYDRARALLRTVKGHAEATSGAKTPTPPGPD